MLQDIQTLNEWALEGRLEVTAISLHTYPFVQDRYALLPHGASIGPATGRSSSRREPLTLEQLRERRDRRARPDDDGVPRCCGSRSATSASASCRSTGSSTRSTGGRAEAGLVIHEGQLTYEAAGLAEVRSTSASGGCSRRACRCRSGSNVARRDVGDRLPDLSAVLRDVDPGRARQPAEAMRVRDALRPRASTTRSPTASSACT